jgi:hypothetical protein
MIDHEYAHHIQLSSDWRIEDEQTEGVHTVDIYDASLTTVLDNLIKFLAAEYEVDRAFVVARVIEHLSER